MFALGVRGSFAAAHRLESYEGKCEALHGHNFFVETLYEGDGLNKDGMLVDFKILKENLRDVLNTLDHTYINEIPFFSGRASSSEYIAMYVFEELEKLLQGSRVSLKEVRVWESGDAYAAYRK